MNARMKDALDETLLLSDKWDLLHFLIREILNSDRQNRPRPRGRHRRQRERIVQSERSGKTPFGI
jgi:hypothetical protein